jgi:glycosyltransferase involved in cell wall biosynthesis
LADEYDITVFAVECDNPRPDRITFVRVPAPLRPQVLLFLVFHALAPLIFWVHCWRRKQRFDLVQIHGNLTFLGELSYAHFCHAVYLRKHWKAVRTLSVRSFFQWMNHFVNARLEGLIYQRARMIVVPSQGLVRELMSEYPAIAGKIVVIPNPVDVRRLRKPDGFREQPLRESLGFTSRDLVLVFVALGHFERKGLPLLLECLRRRQGAEWKLLVVGGSPQIIDAYQRLAESDGVSDRVVFAGHQQDVRPYFWAGDAFVLPSYYEVFPLVALQAAAAGLPVIVSRLNGVEEFVEDGANGFLVERDPASLERAISQVARQPPTQRTTMGLRAQADVEKYDTTFFANNWRSFYERILGVREQEVVS